MKSGPTAPPVQTPLKILSRIVHISFEVGVFLKGFDGLLEILGGLLLSMLTAEKINQGVAVLTEHELSRDPNDWIANHLVSLAADLSVGAKNYAVFYLLLHGILKVFIVWALFRSKLWAFPAAMGLFAAFDVYQTYRFTLSHSPFLAALILLDVAIIALTGAEYGRLKREDKRESGPKKK